MTSDDRRPIETVTAFLAAWATREPARRVEQLRAVCADDVRYTDPAVNARGIAALSAHMGAVGSRFAGHRIVLTSGIDHHHEVARFGWTAYDQAGNAALHGTDLVEFTEDYRLRSITGFFGPLPPRTYTFTG